MIDAPLLTAAGRVPVGVWTEWYSRSGWTNEGMTRLLGFIVEGAAQQGDHIFHIVVFRQIYKEVAEDLQALRAERDVDYVIHVTESSGEAAEDVDELIALANSVQVRGWISLYPHMVNAVRLTAPVAAIFPDANPVSYPNIGAEWDAKGAHTLWRQRVSALLGHASRVITFSRHVAEDEAKNIFNISAEKIRVVPNAPPDLGHLLPFVQDRRKTAESLGRAADLLRQHAQERNWGYLSSFPFEESRFFVVSTQDRTTKNLARAVPALVNVVREHFIDLKMITTAILHRGADWTLFPQAVRNFALDLDVISTPALPRDVHAALYHCAALAVHPAFFEGGLGSFPFYEAVSVGTPCLMADGPHTQEFLEIAPDYAPYVFEPHDAAGLARLIRLALADAPSVLTIQRGIFERLQTWNNWRTVANAYAEAATFAV